MIEQDPRLQKGAYITDGADLYEVIGYRVGPVMMGIRTARLVVEDCRVLREQELGADAIRTGYSLVRRAPAACCPDLFEEIVWEAPPAAAGGRGRARRDAWPQAA